MDIEDREEDPDPQRPAAGFGLDLARVDDAAVGGRHHRAGVTGDLPGRIAEEDGREEPQEEGEGRSNPPLECEADAGHGDQGQ